MGGKRVWWLPIGVVIILVGCQCQFEEKDASSVVVYGDS